MEDERELADLYAIWLGERYETDVVYSGTDAKDRLQNGQYDVVLLDRRMPDVSGDKVLETIQNEELDCHIAMVTAVSPNFDIIEMGFDSYAVKPVTADDLYDLVDRLYNLTNYERQIQRLYSLIQKRALLKAEKNADELANSEEYESLTEEISTLLDESRVSLGEVGDEEFRSLMHGFIATDQETAGE